MTKKELGFVTLFLLAIACIFFYKSVIFGFVPFPGDLLIAEYSPWKTYSYLGYNPGSYPNKAQYFDVLRQLYPWKTLSIELIGNKEFPLWNPYNFSGAPLLANFQAAVFYPLNILYFLFPQITSWTILVIFQPFLAGIFTFLFARKIGIGIIGAIFSSIAYSYSLFILVFLEYNTIGHVIAWLPLVLLSVELLLDKIKFWWIMLFVVSIVASFFGGHIQIFGFLISFVFTYILYRIVVRKWHLRKIFFNAGMMVFLIALSLGIVAIQLFPTIELISNSARVNQDYTFLIEKLLIQPYQVILLLSPDFFGNPTTRNYLLSDSYPGNALYIGIIPFIFSLFAFLLFKKNTFVRYFSLSAIVLLILFIRSPLTELLYTLNIPLFSTGSPTNAIFLLSFSLAILAGFGFDEWIKKTSKNQSMVIISIGTILILVWGLMALKVISVSNKNYLYTGALFIVFVLLYASLDFFRKTKINTLILYVVLAITIFDLFYFFQKFNPFVSAKLVFPRTEVFNFLKRNAAFNRFWGYGSANVEANVETKYRLFSPNGYDPLYPRRYGEFIQASRNGKIETRFTRQTRSDAAVASGFGETDLSSNYYRLKVMDLLGVKYILDRLENGSTQRTFPRERFKLAYEKDGWKIFENLKALPRAFLVSDYKVFRSKEEFGKKFFDKNFDPSKTILLEENPSFYSSSEVSPKADESRSSRQDGYQMVTRQARTVSLVSYKPNKIVFLTTNQSDQILFLSDTYYPGWKALIDEKETKIYRANYAFRSVFVPKGVHTVAFEYRPSSFSTGIKVSIISVIVLFAGAYFLSKYKIPYEH